MGNGCAPALAPTGNKPAFYVTAQHANGLTCDTSAQPTGTNNVYGCGTIGSTADHTSCTPLTRMLRDSDCNAQMPWSCADGALGTSTTELNIITKSSSARGGALCCKD
jgi:hypothetical protein